jgi:hypothetical protein
VQGANVNAGSATATTDAAGRATLIVPERGEIAVQAVRGTRASRSAPVATCSTDGADGFCDTFVPPSPPVEQSAAFVRDTVAPHALVTAVEEGQRFARGKGPRTLEGSVGEPVVMVKLRLTRRAPNGRCFTFSGSRERFVKRPCGAANGWWFKVGESSDWSYLLPKRLPAGRYVLDVNAIDKAYNRDDERRRGENRVVFVVR